MKKDYEKTVARQRFSALYDPIIDAGLDDEYDEYVERHPHVIRYRTPSPTECGMFNVICICPATRSYAEFFSKPKDTVGMETISYKHFISLSRRFCEWNWDEGLY